MQLNEPLSPTLSPFHGEREKLPRARTNSLDGDWPGKGAAGSLSPRQWGEGQGEGLLLLHRYGLKLELQTPTLPRSNTPRASVVREHG